MSGVTAEKAIEAVNRLIAKKYSKIMREPQQNGSYLSRIWRKDKSTYQQHVKRFNAKIESEEDSLVASATRADLSGGSNNRDNAGGVDFGAGNDNTKAQGRVAGSLPAGDKASTRARFGSNDGESANPEATGNALPNNLVNYTPDFNFMDHFTFGEQLGSHRISYMTTGMQALIKGITLRQNQQDLATEAMSAMSRGDDRLIAKFLRGTYVKNVPVSGRTKGTVLSYIPAKNHILGTLNDSSPREYLPDYALLHRISARIKNDQGAAWFTDLSLVKELGQARYIALTSNTGWADFVAQNNRNSSTAVRMGHRDFFGKDLITKSYESFPTIANFPIITVPDEIYNSKFERYKAGEHIRPAVGNANDGAGSNIVRATNVAAKGHKLQYGIGEASELDIQWSAVPDTTSDIVGGLHEGEEVGYNDAGNNKISPYGMFSMMFIPTKMFAFNEPLQLRKPVKFRTRPDLEWDMQLFGRHVLKGMLCFPEYCYRLFWTPEGVKANVYAKTVS